MSQIRFVGSAPRTPSQPLAGTPRGGEYALATIPRGPCRVNAAAARANVGAAAVGGRPPRRTPTPTTQYGRRATPGVIACGRPRGRPAGRRHERDRDRRTLGCWKVDAGGRARVGDRRTGRRARGSLRWLGRPRGRRGPARGGGAAPDRDGARRACAPLRLGRRRVERAVAAACAAAADRRGRRRRRCGRRAVHEPARVAGAARGRPARPTAPARRRRLRSPAGALGGPGG